VKYVPLVWAALMRKPVRAILTWLSVTIAFILFGLTIGMNATFDKVAASARNDRIYTGARFGGTEPPVAMARQLEQVPGVAMVGYNSFLLGYHEKPTNRVFVLMTDPNLSKMMTEWPVTPAQWALLHKNRTGILVSRMAADAWHLKPGDNFTIAAPQNPRADGKPWTLHVLGVVGDVAYMQSYMLGNYDYFNKSLPPARQDKVGQFYVQSADPGHTAELAQRIDAHFSSSAVPTQSITEKAALDITNSGMDIAAVDRDIAMAGMFMVLFLTANGIAQSVRERFSEFATLKTIGFSDRGVVSLVFLEAAVPCLLGAGLGVALADLLAHLLPQLFPKGQVPPIPTISTAVFLWGALCAAGVALLASALPALRLKQMDIATALSGR
jgi:putative ABC transport system permease protein